MIRRPQRPECSRGRSRSSHPVVRAVQQQPTAGKNRGYVGRIRPDTPWPHQLAQESRRYGDVVVAIVNGDAFLTAKKGKPFQDLETRCTIVSAINGIDYVVPFEIEGDMTVRQALRWLRPDVFAKGGDRIEPASIPEWDVCQELGIEVISGVGDAKRWSSSWFLEDWSKHVIQEHSRS